MYTIKLDVDLPKILFHSSPLKERLRQALKLVCETLPTLDGEGAVFIEEQGRLKMLASWCTSGPAKAAPGKSRGERGVVPICPDQDRPTELARDAPDLSHKARMATRDGYLDIVLPGRERPSGILRFRTIPGRNPSTKETATLRRVAALIALTISLERTSHEKRGTAQHANLLARAVETIVGAHRKDGISQLLCEQLADAGGFDLVVMYGNETTGGELSPVAVAGKLAAALRTECSNAHLQPSHVWDAVLGGQTYFVENVLEELASTPLANVLPKGQKYSAVAIPYRVNGRVGGALCIVANDTKGPLLNNVDVLDLIARMYAEARSHHLSRDTLELLRAVVEQSPESVLITDTNGKVLYCNRAFSQETGYKKGEVLGKTPRILKSGAHNDAFYQQLWKTLLSGKVFSAIFVNKKKSGALYKTSRIIAPINVGTTSYFVAFGRDITEEEQLKSDLVTVVNALPHPVIKVDTAGRLLHFNQAAGQIFGLEQRHEGLLLETVLGNWFLQVWESVARALQNDPPPPKRIARGNRVFMLYAQPIPDLLGNPIAAATVFVDVTSLEEESAFRQALLQLSKDVVREGRPYQRILEFAVRHTPGAAAGSLLVGGGKKPYVFKALVGYSRKLLNQKMPARVRWPAGRSGPEIYRVTDEMRSRIRSEYPLLYKMGRIDEIAEVLTAVVPLSDTEFIVFNLDAFQPNTFGRIAIERMGLLANSLGYFLGWKHQKERSAHIAYHDELTGLPNRKYLMDMAPRILARAKRGEPVCVMKIDVSNLNNINNLLGTRAGDKALKTIAKRLESTLYEGDLLTRVAGDEFIAVLPKCDATGARTAAARILRRMKEPFNIRGRTIPAHIVIGVSVAPGDGSNLDGLLRKAGLALLRAKEEGAPLAFYNPALEKEQRVHQAVEIELEVALSKNELELFVQPILDLDNNRYAHFEILLRWKFSPTVFVPVAEQTGLGPTLDAYVLKRAERLAQLLKRPVFVNLLPSTLKEGLPEFPDPNLVGFEITEHGLVKPEAIEQVQNLASLGYRLALDDFGTKYSNLALLAELPINFVKMDRSLVSRALEPGDAKGKALFEGLVAA
ncbi:diguanylate cyclase domain-containing protein, partial [Oceanithermus profundus]